MKTIKKSSLSVILMVVAVCALFTATLFGVNSKNAFAEETTAEYTLEVSDGISLKLNEQGGMRFVVKTDKTTYGYLKNNDGVTLNVLIGPASQFTDEATYATLKDSLINITVDKNKIYQIGGDENYYANACVVEMRDENREIDYTAVAYLVNGETVEAQSAVNAKSTGDFYAVTNQSVIETTSTADIFANAAYSWFGTENYAIKLDTLDEYNAFIAKIDGVDLTEKYVTLGDYEVADKSKLAAFKHVTAQNKITAVTVSDVAYGTAPVPTATAYFGAGTVTYTYATAIDGEYSAWNAANGIGTYYVKATVAAGEDGNVSYASAEKVAEFTVTKAANAISGFTKDESVTLHCGDALPTYTATATFGTVEYTYSLNGTDYSDSVTLVEGTLYVKATVAATADYSGAEETLTYSVTHSYSETTVDGITTKTCACGKKEVSGNIANSQISLNVAVSDGVATATAGELDLTKAFAENATATVTVGETEVTDVQIASGKISLAGADFAGVYGTQSVNVKFVVGNTSYDLTVTAFFETKNVKTEAELQGVKDIVDALNGAGYYTLGNDIKLTTNWYTKDDANYTIAFKTPFIGTFDGCGFTVDGLKFVNNWGHSEGYAFIQNLGNGGTLKNVGFTNVNCPQKGSIVKASKDGIIENVFVKYSARGLNQHKAATFGGTQDLTTEITYFKITLRNVVVDVSDVASYWGSKEALSAQSKILGKFTSDSTLENIVVYGVPSEFNANNVIGIQNVEDFSISTSIDGIYVYNKDTNTANKAIPATGWDSEYWTVNSNSLPVFKTAASALATTATFAVSEKNITKGTSATFTAGKNCVIELGEDANALGVTYYNGMVVVPESATAGATFTVIARNIFDFDNSLEFKVTVLNEIIAKTIDGSNIALDINVSTEGVSAGKDSTIDLSTLAEYTDTCSDVTVSYNGLTLGNASVTNGVLTFNTAGIDAKGVVGDLIVTIIGTDVNYKITLTNVRAVTKLISTVTDLQSIKAISNALGYDGYYMLANNIKFGSSDIWYDGTTNYSIGESEANAFKGTIDGAGYSIDNIVFKNNWNSTGFGFIQYLGEGGILKNIAFTNFNGSDKNSVIKFIVKGTVENVYVQYSAKSNTQKWVATFNEAEWYVATLKNVVVDFTGVTIGDLTNADAAFLGRYKAGSTIENVAVIGLESKFNNNIIKIGTDASISGIYVYNPDTASAAEGCKAFSAEGWSETYWTVDAENSTVTWKTKA